MDHKAFLILLFGCGGVPQDPPTLPLARDGNQQLETAVRVDVECVTPEEPSMVSFPSPITSMVQDRMTGLWTVDFVGSGVMVSGHRALTALHVVRCPYVPSITVSSPWIGESWAAVGKRKGKNALLILDEGGRAIPPLVREPRLGEEICTDPSFPDRAEECGIYQGDLTAELRTTHGNSGAPVYANDGWLVGLVQAGDETYTEISLVDEDFIR